MNSIECPLFPLGTVLQPGGPLMLRIFEARYLDMVSACMRHNTGFVVVLIREGREVGPVTFHSVGTLAKIVDWHQYEDGLLGITAVGESRVRIVDTQRQSDGLNIGSVELLAPDEAVALPEKFQYMARLARQLIAQLDSQYDCVVQNYDDATWVASRLAEILPMTSLQRQTCLEITQPLERLELVANVIREITRKNN